MPSAPTEQLPAGATTKTTKPIPQTGCSKQSAHGTVVIRAVYEPTQHRHLLGRATRHGLNGYAPDGQFTAVAAGEFHYMWQYEPIPTPSPAGAPTGLAKPMHRTDNSPTVSAGANHSCGTVRANDTITCWGDNGSRAKPTHPDGQFSAVSAAAIHTLLRTTKRTTPSPAGAPTGSGHTDRTGADNSPPSAQAGNHTCAGYAPTPRSPAGATTVSGKHVRAGRTIHRYQRRNVPTAVGYSPLEQHHLLGDIDWDESNRNTPSGQFTAISRRPH